LTNVSDVEADTQEKTESEVVEGGILPTLQIEKSVTNLLVATKQLLETFTNGLGIRRRMRKSQMYTCDWATNSTSHAEHSRRSRLIAPI
jgi:hypothetical protein